MFKIIIKGLKGGAVEEVKINPMEFDRNDLTDTLADLTLDLIDRKLLSSSREPNERVKIYLQFGENELLLCHYNGRLLADLNLDLASSKGLKNFNYPLEQYVDAYDLIEDIVAHEFSDYLDASLAELESLLDELQYADGSKYKGDIEDGNPHGRGRMQWADGSSYDGQWRNGLHHGNGTYVWPDGAEYTGAWRDGKMHGKGTFKSASGEITEGKFKDGAFDSAN